MPAMTGIIEPIIVFCLGAHVGPQLATKDATLHEKPRGIGF
jgi:hypothetical protein